jgi:hypothetical protein
MTDFAWHSAGAVLVLALFVLLPAGMAAPGVVVPAHAIHPAPAWPRLSWAAPIRYGFGPTHDEQIGESFASLASNTTLAYNVTATEQLAADGGGIGPAYLLNGLTDSTFWYQVGLVYDWPYQSGGSLPGFEAVFETFAPGGTTAGASAKNFSGPVNSGDVVTLRLYFSNGLLIGSATDIDTGASANQTYFAAGSSFVATPSAPSDSNGYFTGLMTEEYHYTPYNGTMLPVVYSSSTPEQSAWLWADEFDEYSGVLFVSQSHSPVSLTDSASSLSADGAAVYSTSNGLLTGSPGLEAELGHAPSAALDVGQNASDTFSVSTSGGLPPLSWSAVVDGRAAAPSNSSATAFSGQARLWGRTEGTGAFLVAVTDALGQEANTTAVRYVVNSDPALTMEYQPAYDVGMPLNLTYSATGGSPPYSFSVSPFRSDTPGNYTVFVILRDSAGFTRTGRAAVVVNPDPTLQVRYQAVYDVGMPVNMSEAAHGGTPPYAYASTQFTTGSPGNYSVAVSMRDGAGFTRSMNISLDVNPRPTVNLTVGSSVVDYGMSVNYTLGGSGGTAPVTYGWYLNGARVSASCSGAACIPALPQGTDNVTVVGRDRLGTEARSSAFLTVNPDPELSVSATTDSSLLYSDLGVTEKPSVSAGTPPYSCALLVGGVAVETSEGCAAMKYEFGSMGEQNVSVALTDAAGYRVASTTERVAYSYNYVGIGGAAAAGGAAVALAAWAFARRRKGASSSRTVPGRRIAPFKPVELRRDRRLPLAGCERTG